MNVVQTVALWIAVLLAIVLLLAGAIRLFVWYVTRD